MAGGSYSQQPIPGEPTPTAVPPRTTRRLRVVRDDESSDTEEQETHFLPALRQTTRQPQPPEVYTGIPVYKFKEQPLARHRPWLLPLTVIIVCVVVGVLVLVSAGMFQRTDGSRLVNFPEGQSYAVQVGGSIDNVNAWENSNGPLPPKKPLPTGPYSVLGKPTLTVAFINAVLASYHSPAAGKGRALYNYGVQYGIDPAFALAFFLHESTMGTAGEARTTLSLGNLRCIPARPCIDQDRGGYTQMNSWEDGFLQWYKLIRNL